MKPQKKFAGNPENLSQGMDHIIDKSNESNCDSLTIGV
jgi:hypothetical protein